MKALLFLLFFSPFASAQINGELVYQKTQQVDEITVKDIKRYLMSDGVYETRTTENRKLSNAVEFFPDNIVLPISPDNPNVVKIEQVNLDNMNKELKEFIEKTNSSFNEGYKLISNKLIIEASATNVPATTDVPPGYTEEQVRVSYKDSNRPNNQDLMERRAKNLKAVLLKFIPELNQLLLTKRITISTTTKTASDRYVKIQGLEFKKESKKSRYKREFACGESMPVRNGRQGIKEKNWLYLDEDSSGDFTRVVSLGSHNNKKTRTVQVLFTTYLIPDRCEIYAKKADGKEELLDDCGDQFFAKNNNITDQQRVVSEFQDKNIKKGVIFTQDSFSKIFQLTNKDITHILVKVYSPLDGTIFSLNTFCNYEK